jgi:hypothetical protein
MLTECGLTKVQNDAGDEWVFRPCFARIAELGRPHEIVELFADLHGPRGLSAARYILHTLCDTPAHDLTGWLDGEAWHDGSMPQSEQIIIAKHLMMHGICGTAKTGKGEFQPEFKASEYIASAVVHFGMTQAEAGELSMTQFQELFAQKFPEAVKQAPPTRDEYKKFMADIAKKQKAS